MLEQREEINCLRFLLTVEELQDDVAKWINGYTEKQSYFEKNRYDKTP